MAYSCGETNITPPGPVCFGDGIQIWFNSRIEREYGT
jgi:hypothetical protein